MQPDTKSILLFAEDPGAANYLTAFLGPLRNVGCKTHLFACGAARNQFKIQGVEARAMPDSVAGMLDQVSPDFAILGTSNNPETIGLEVLDTAKERRIPVAGVVDSIASAHLRFRGNSDNPLKFMPDWILVPDERTQQRYEALGVSAGQIRVCGFPQYSLALSRMPELQGIGRTRTRERVFPAELRDSFVTLFVADAPIRKENYFGLAENFEGWRQTKERCSVVLEEVIDACASMMPKPALVVRPHPRDAAGAFDRYESHVSRIDKDPHPLEAVYAADLVVGLAASLLFEACAMGVRAISVLAAEQERALVPSVLADRLTIVSNRQELREKISAATAGTWASRTAAMDLSPLSPSLESLFREMFMQPKAPRL